jgi:hypothetical protein
VPAGASGLAIFETWESDEFSSHISTIPRCGAPAGQFSKSAIAGFDTYWLTVLAQN